MPRLNRQIQYAPKGVLGEVAGDTTPESLSFSYNPDNTVLGIIGDGGLNLSFTYNVDKTVDTINDGTYTRTFSYNANKTVDEITVS
jgi:hypothetical protein